MSEVTTTRVFFSGTVQGVGFRYRTLHLARGYSVTGYVRNLPDGRVELVAQGDADEIERFVQALRDSMADYIRGESREELPDAPRFESFQIRY